MIGPNPPVHPGEILREEFKVPLALSGYALARRISHHGDGAGALLGAVVVACIAIGLGAALVLWGASIVLPPSYATLWLLALGRQLRAMVATQMRVAQPFDHAFFVNLHSSDLADPQLYAAALRALPATPHQLLLRILWPWSLLRKSMLLTDANPNDRGYLEVEIPAGNGVGTARSMAPPSARAE